MQHDAVFDIPAHALPVADVSSTGLLRRHYTTSFKQSKSYTVCEFVCLLADDEKTTCVVEKEERFSVQVDDDVLAEGRTKKMYRVRFLCLLTPLDSDNLFIVDTPGWQSICCKEVLSPEGGSAEYFICGEHFRIEAGAGYHGHRHFNLR